jgi:hypothetical protein
MKNFVTLNLDDYLELLNENQEMEKEIKEAKERFDKLRIDGVINYVAETTDISSGFKTSHIELKIWIDKDLSEEAAQKLEILFKQLVPEKAVPELEIVQASASKSYRFWNIFNKK